MESTKKCGAILQKNKPPRAASPSILVEPGFASSQDTKLRTGRTAFRSAPPSMSVEACTYPRATIASAAFLPGGANIDQLFETLAQWNEYLEKHVPYFSEGSKPQEQGQ